MSRLFQSPVHAKAWALSSSLLWCNTLITTVCSPRWLISSPYLTRMRMLLGPFWDLEAPKGNLPRADVPLHAPPPLPPPKEFPVLHAPRRGPCPKHLDHLNMEARETARPGGPLPSMSPSERTLWRPLAPGAAQPVLSFSLPRVGPEI
jgi:hypothetical protein